MHFLKFEGKNNAQTITNLLQQQFFCFTKSIQFNFQLFNSNCQIFVFQSIICELRCWCRRESSLGLLNRRTDLYNSKLTAKDKAKLIVDVGGKVT